MKTKSKKGLVDNLSQDEKLLVVLRDELYGGSWDRMIDELKSRLQGRPFIFKLANRIEADLTRIRKLKAFERKSRINLTDYVKGDKK